MARNTFPNLAALERRVRRELPYVVERGCEALAIERGEADLARENANMPRQAKLDADTVEYRKRLPEAKDASTPLVRTGQLRDSGVVRIRVIKSGPNAQKIRYSIRRQGNERQVVSDAARIRHGKRLAEESLLKSRERTKSLRKTRVIGQHDPSTGRTWFIRTMPRGTLAGIMRSGDKNRGVPPRDYSRHLQSWHDAISNRLIRKHLSDQLGKTGLRVIKSGAKFVVQVIQIAAREAV